MVIYIEGFLIFLACLVVIGRQNTFILKNGLLKRYVLFPTIIFCISYFVLVFIGIWGIGNLFLSNQKLHLVLSIVGALFLLAYGWSAFFRATHTKKFILSGILKSETHQKTILATVLIIFLSPTVYLDTLIVIGSISGTLDVSKKIPFFLGVISACLMWFFTLSYGAKQLIPLFKKPILWKVLDLSIGLIMWMAAFEMIQYIVKITT